MLAHPPSSLAQQPPVKAEQLSSTDNNAAAASSPSFKPPAFTIKVTLPSGLVFPLAVRGSYSLSVVKSMVKGQHGIPLSGQKMFYVGKELPEDNSTLDSLGISADSSLTLEANVEDEIAVFIQPTMADEVAFSMQVNKKDTVGQVKRLIGQRKSAEASQEAQPEYGPVWLVYDTMTLKDDRTVESYGIRNGDSIQMRSIMA